MSSTNKTKNLKLSQFVATDRPTPLVDYNDDMRKIDNAYGSVNIRLEDAVTNAREALERANTAYATSKEVHDLAVKAERDADTAKTLSTESLEVSTNTAALSQLLDKSLKQSKSVLVWENKSNLDGTFEAQDIHFSVDAWGTDFADVVKNSTVELTYIASGTYDKYMTVDVPFAPAELRDESVNIVSNTQSMGIEINKYNRMISMDVDAKEAIIRISNCNKQSKSILMARGSGEPSITENDVEIITDRIIPLTIVIRPYGV